MVITKEHLEAVSQVLDEIRQSDHFNNGAMLGKAVRQPVYVRDGGFDVVLYASGKVEIDPFRSHCRKKKCPVCAEAAKLQPTL